MSEHFNIGETAVGTGQPTYVVAEIGINHNGDLDTAKKLIDVAVEDQPHVEYEGPVAHAVR